MDVCVPHKLEDLRRILIVLEFYLELIIHIPEALDTTIFPGGDLAAGLDDLRLSPAQLLKIVELIISSVLQGSISVDT